MTQAGVATDLRIRPRAYVICTAPRTGSSLLSDALWKTGVTGHPAEYFDIHERNQTFWTRRLGVERPELFLDAVLRAGVTPNGLFGLKLHWHQIPALFAAVQAARPPGDPRPPHKALDACLAEVFPSVQYLWLRRRNKVAQAISYYLASGTDVWSVPVNPAQRIAPQAGPVAFDFAEIDRHVDLVNQFDMRWRDYFTRTRAPALVLIYEDFIKSYEPTVRAICDYLGALGQTIQPTPPAFEKQADVQSMEWEQRYRRMKGLPAEDPDEPPAPAVRAGPAEEAGRARPAPRLARDDQRIIAYDLGAQVGVEIAAASPRRAWMDAVPQRFVYRCLPLVIANQNGWVLTCPHRVEAVWDGGPLVDSLRVAQDAGGNPQFAASHFGAGVLTFTTGLLFRTPPGINLHVRGPANLPKDGISALEGIVETDWSEATFTMNWKMTRPNHPVVFEKGEPFAMITPVRRGEIETLQPEIRMLADNPVLDVGYRAWARSRSNFNAELKVKDSAAQKLGWQRHYVRGQTILDHKAEDHQTSLSVKPFSDHRRRTKPFA
jgi:LPS sulfotransferase NodH